MHKCESNLDTDRLDDEDGEMEICRVEGLFVHLMRHWSGIIPKHPALVNSMNREASGKQYEHCVVGV